MEKLYIFLRNRYNYVYMRIFILALLFFCVPMLSISAHAQDNMPRRTFDPVEPVKPVVRPLNLKSILKGKSSKKKSKRSGPVSQNTMELLRSGNPLPFSRSLAETADYNQARDILRRTNSFDGLDNRTIQAKLEVVRSQEEANRQAQWERRNKFYIAHGMADEHTREYLRSKQGRLFKRHVRKEEREQEEAAEDKAKLVSQKLKAQKENVYQPFETDAEKDSGPRVVVPTAKPGKDGTIKPFFYR